MKPMYDKAHKNDPDYKAEFGWEVRDGQGKLRRHHPGTIRIRSPNQVPPDQEEEDE